MHLLYHLILIRSDGKHFQTFLFIEENHTVINYEVNMPLSAFLRDASTSRHEVPRYRRRKAVQALLDAKIKRDLLHRPLRTTP